MTRELLTIPNDILRSVCEPAQDIDSEVKVLAQELIDYMIAHREDEVAPIGLAAPQLGGLIRVISFYPNAYYREKDSVEVLVNPMIIELRDIVEVSETCLSVPGKRFIVRRAKRAKVRGLNLEGQEKTYKGVGLLAQVLQHEIDHLNGVLIDSIGRRV